METHFLLSSNFTFGIHVSILDAASCFVLFCFVHMNLRLRLCLHNVSVFPSDVAFGTLQIIFRIKWSVSCPTERKWSSSCRLSEVSLSRCRWRSVLFKFGGGGSHSQKNNWNNIGHINPLEQTSLETKEEMKVTLHIDVLVICVPVSCKFRIVPSAVQWIIRYQKVKLKPLCFVCKGSFLLNHVLENWMDRP